MQRHGGDKVKRTVNIDARSLIIFICVVIAVSSAIIVGINIVKSFMTVSSFEIVGVCPYDEEQILTECGIRRGEKLYSIDTEALEEKLKKRLPYLLEVEVDTKFPSTLVIELSSRVAAWYVELGGDFYALDSELFVLEESYSEQKFIDGGITKLSLPSIKKAIVGSTLVYGETDSDVKFGEEVMRTIRSTPFKSRITQADLSSRFEIRIRVDDNISVYLGSFADIETKLSAVESALEDSKLDNCISAEIDASNPSRVYVKPEYDYTTDTNTTNG